MSLCFAAAAGLALLACSSDEKDELPPVDIDTPPLLPDNGGGAIFEDEDPPPGEGLDPSQICAGQEAGTELAPAVVELLEARVGSGATAAR